MAERQNVAGATGYKRLCDGITVALIIHLDSEDCELNAIQSFALTMPGRGVMSWPFNLHVGQWCKRALVSHTAVGVLC